MCRYNVPGKWSNELPCYSSPNVYCDGWRTGDAQHDNVKQLRLAAPKMSSVGNDNVQCSATVDNNNFARGNWVL